MMFIMMMQGRRKLDLFGQAIASCMEHTCMQSMHILGGLGACPPENFGKLHPLGLILRLFLMNYNMSGTYTVS